MLRFNQFLTGRSDLFHASFVGVQLLLEILMLLNLPPQICGIQITLISGELQLLIDPSLCLVTIALKLLQLVGIFKSSATNRRFFFQSRTAIQQLSKQRNPLVNKMYCVTKVFTMALLWATSSAA